MTSEERSEVVAKREKLRTTTERYRRILRLWNSDPIRTFLSHDNPRAFLDWAAKKNIEVGWRAWYEAHFPAVIRPSEPAKQPEEEAVSARAETTYLNIIGGLLGLILGNTPAGKKQSVFENQSAIVASLLATYPRKPGIAERTLQQKFALAKRSIESS